MPRQSRRAFTLIELLVVTSILAAVVAMVLPAVQRVREAANRAQCQNNLKQMGVAVLMYNDTSGGLPPASTGNTGLTVFALLLPYLEQTNLANSLDYEASGLYGGAASDERVVGLVMAGQSLKNFNALLDGSVGIKTFLCPSRRGQRASIIARREFPVGDYGVVVVGATDIFYRSLNTQHKQALRIARTTHKKNLIDLPAHVPNPGDVSQSVIEEDGTYYPGRPFPVLEPLKGWRPRDRMSRITDGASNTAIIAEKHLTPGDLGRCCGPMHGGKNGGDGYIYWARDRGPGGYGQLAVPANVGRGIARTPTEGEGLPFTTTPAIGSWHPGSAHFLFADGSVRALSGSTSLEMLRRIGDVSDGLTVQFE